MVCAAEEGLSFGVAERLVAATEPTPPSLFELGSPASRGTISMHVGFGLRTLHNVISESC